MTDQDIVRRFTYHKPDEKKAEMHAMIRAKFFELACTLNALLPENREKAVAFTELETAQFWANAAIAREGETKG